MRRRARGRGWPTAREILDILHVVRALAGEQLVEHEPERIDVGALRQLAAGELLGRHVLRRAGARLEPPDAGGGAGQTEVGDLRAAAPVDHHVGGLEIAVQHTFLVRGGQPRAQLSRDLNRLVFGKMADAPEQRRQVLAVHVLHREKVPAVGLRHVEHAADVRMRHA